MYALTAKLRKRLKRPLGDLLTETEIKKLKKGAKRKIVVGDRTVLAFLERNIIPDVCIYDKKEKRKKIPETEARILDALPFKTIEVRNKAGTIQEEVWAALEEAKKEKTKIFVRGEEDLLVIPALLVLNGTVYYGQPGKGIVQVPTCRKTQAEAKKILAQMKVVV